MRNCFMRFRNTFSTAVTSLEIYKKDVNGLIQKIVGEIKSKKEAKDIYSDSMSQGKGSYLLEDSGPGLVTLLCWKSSRKTRM